MGGAVQWNSFRFVDLSIRMNGLSADVFVFDRCMNSKNTIFALNNSIALESTMLCFCYMTMESKGCRAIGYGTASNETERVRTFVTWFLLLWWQVIG